MDDTYTNLQLMKLAEMLLMQHKRQEEPISGAGVEHRQRNSVNTCQKRYIEGIVEHSRICDGMAS